MSARIGGQMDEIGKYLDRLKEQKKWSDSKVQTLESEREKIDGQIDQLQKRRQKIEENIDTEQQHVRRLEEVLDNSQQTYVKLLESSQSLVAYVKRECSETDRRGNYES